MCVCVCDTLRARVSGRNKTSVGQTLRENDINTMQPKQLNSRCLSPSRPMQPNLPPEVIEAIIEEIDDREQLAACSRICSAWTPFAQSKYFRHVRIRRMAPFLERIRESPHIALLPRSLSYTGDEDGDGTYLAQIAPLLVNVSTLYLENVDLESSESIRGITEGFPSLQSLYLSVFALELHILSSFFQSHPALHTLSLDRGTITSTANEHQELLSLRHLRHLLVTYPGFIPPLIPVLVDRETPLAQIERLTLSYCSSDESHVAAISTLLFGLRHSLHVLEIDSPPIGADSHTLDALVNRLPLEHLSALQELAFPHITLDSHYFRWVNGILQKVQKSGSVETLRFQMWNLHQSQASISDWDTMKTILVAMPHLRLVSFELLGLTPASEARSIVQKGLEGIERKCTFELSAECFLLNE